MGKGCRYMIRSVPDLFVGGVVRGSDVRLGHGKGSFLGRG